MEGWIFRSRWRLIVVALTLATAFGTLAAGQQWLAGRSETGVSFWRLVALTLPFWYWWVALAPMVIRISRWIPVEREGIVWRLPAHVGAAVAVAACHSLLHITTVVLIQRALGEELVWRTIRSAIMSVTFFEMSMNFLAYALIVGLTHAAEYHRRLTERELVAADLSERLTRATLDALRMQLNPHFLFNAMNTVSMLVRQRENEQAVKVIAGLSDLLRYVLQEQREQEVPLREELEFVERYLAIERIRFGDRLSVTVTRPDDLLDAFVPSLVLQPLVENAIRHGVAERADAGAVEIAVMRHGGRLSLSVCDDGAGLTGAEPSDGVGVRNTRERLDRLYGSNQSFQLRARESGGAEARIEIPLRLTPAMEGGA